MHAHARVGQGILLITHAIPDDVAADCEAWFLREHLPERLGVPGFLRGRRFAGIAGAPGFLVIYDTVSPQVLDSPPYHARLAQPSTWTTRIMQRFLDMRRSVLRVEATHGHVDGSSAVLWEFTAADAAVAGRALLEGLPAIALRPGICAAHLWQDAGIVSPVTAEARLRGAPDQSVAGAVCVEGLDEASLRGAAGAIDMLLPTGTRAAPRYYALQCVGTAAASG